MLRTGGDNEQGDKYSWNFLQVIKKDVTVKPFYDCVDH